MNAPVCSLCGHNRDVHAALLAWDEDMAAELGREYDQGYRCRDHAACIRRVDESGERWPLRVASTEQLVGGTR